MALAPALRSALACLALALAACSSPSSEAQAPLSNRVVMTVTDKGFEPKNLRVRKGEPVTLLITRKSDATCATDIVIDEYKIKTPLPLNKQIEVTFTPKKDGELKYGCAMQKMIGGVIRVE